MNDMIDKPTGYPATERKNTRFPIQSWAIVLVRHAIKAGRLVNPGCCEECKTTKRRVEAHHDDYLKPLKVRWLCASCHKRWHGLEGPGKNILAPVPEGGLKMASGRRQPFQEQPVTYHNDFCSKKCRVAWKAKSKEPWWKWNPNWVTTYRDQRKCLWCWEPRWTP